MDAKYNSLVDKALSFHKYNKLDEAEELYKGLLMINPDDVNVLNYYAMLCLTKNRAFDAVDLLSKALILNNSPILMSNLAKAYYMAGDAANSVIFYEKAAAVSPSDDIYYSLAIALKQLNKIDKAIEAYNKALKINPNNYNVLYNLSVLYRDNGDIDLALNTAVKAEFINPDDEDVQSVLSGLYEAKGEYLKSVAHLRKAYSINPKQYLYLYNEGVLYSKIGNNDDAIESYSKILVINPKHLETLINLSNLLKDKDKNQALKYLEYAFSLYPDNEIIRLSLAQIYRDLYYNDKSMQLLNSLNCAQAYSLMAINLMDQLRYNEALEYYNKAIQCEQNGNYYHGKAMALKYLGDFSQAKAILENIKDKSLQTITTLGMMYLQEKDFNRGMELYIKRSLDTKFHQLFKEKVWQKGMELKDKVILLYSDCGLGDTIMFSRYIPLLQNIAKKVILQTDKELIRLLNQSFSGIEIIPKSQQVPYFDIVMPVMNIAYALNMNFDCIPNANGYLISNRAEIKSDKLKVGIFYQGNRRVFKNRSIPFPLINKLDNDNIQLYSFQIENFEEETNSVINLREKIKDYADSASLLRAMDIMVTIDSSIAHASGALGVKTFLLLPYTAEWRWFNDDKTTPWYSSVQIFKQNKPSDWNYVINRVIENLK